MLLKKENIKPRAMCQKGRIRDYIKGRNDEVRGVILLTTISKFKSVERNGPSQLTTSLEIGNKNFSKNNADFTQN